MLYKMGTIGDKMVNSDSVNLGSNPSSPATQKPRGIGTSGDFGPVERAVKSEQNAYTGCTEPGTAGTLDIPTDPKAFQRWLTAQGCWTAWPIPLSTLATHAGWALKARTDPDWMAPENRPNRDRHRANWSAFTTAYAQHVGGR